jgi:acetyl esterase/lipase
MPFPSERLALNILNTVALAGPAAVAKDVLYASDPARRLDVYAPASAAAAPVFVFLHGGGWESGAKADDRFVAAALAQRGFVALAVDYRLYPEVGYPAFLEDAARAVAWAVAHAPRFGGDPRRVFLLGHSAGAYIAAMLSLDPRWLGAEGLDPRRDIAGLIGLAGPYDFLPLRSRTLKAIFGPPEDWPQTQPIAYASKDAPPALLAAGGSDNVVDPGNTMRLAHRIRALGGAADIVIYPKLSHGGVLAAFARPLRFLAPVLADVSRFAAAQPARPIRREAS